MTVRRWLAVAAGLLLILATAAAAFAMSRSAAAPASGPTALSAANQLLDRLMSCNEDLACAREVGRDADMRAIRADVFSAALFSRVDSATMRISKGAWCHALGHLVGSALGPALTAAQVTEQLSGINWSGRLSEADAVTCQSGVLHGTLDGWAMRGDVSSLGELVDGNCRQYGDWPSMGAGYLLSDDLAAVGCVHGLGHAVGGALFEAARPSPIPEAWQWCSRIEVPSQARNCLAGALMALNAYKQNTDPESCLGIDGDAGTYCAYQTAYYQRADQSTADRCAALDPSVQQACWDGIAARGGIEQVGPGRATLEQWCTTLPDMTGGAYAAERCAAATVIGMRVINSLGEDFAERVCAKAGSLAGACRSGAGSAEQWLYRDGVS
jgi:hypothetical protein